MQPFVATEVWDEAVLTLLNATADYFSTLCKIGLYTNVIGPTKQSQVGDLTEPTFTGYARVTLAMAAPSRGPGDVIQVNSQLVSFGMTGTPVPTLVQGFFITYGAGPALLGVQPFDTPIQLNDSLDLLELVFVYNESNLAQATYTIVP